MLSVMLTLLVVASTSCSPFVGAITPEDALLDRARQIAPETLPTYRIVGKREWQGNTILLFAYVKPADAQTPPMPIFGYAFVEQTLTGAWQIKTSGAGGGNAPPPAENLVDYREGGGSGSFGQDQYTIVYGQTLAPQVTAVEATFANTQIVRDETSDGTFAIIVPVTTFACELRVLGADGQMLRLVDMGQRRAKNPECRQ